MVVAVAAALMHWVGTSLFRVVPFLYRHCSVSDLERFYFAQVPPFSPFAKAKDK